MTTIRAGWRRLAASGWGGPLLGGWLIIAGALLAVLLARGLSQELCNPSCYVVTSSLGEEVTAPAGYEYYDPATGCWSNCPP